MGIPSAAFRAGDCYIEYAFEGVLFRYEKLTGRFFRKFYDERETEVPFDSELLNDSQRSGVQTTAERYASGRAPARVPSAEAAEGGISRAAVAYQRSRPYWLTVSQRDVTGMGDVEVGADGRLEVVTAADSIRGLLEVLVSDLNGRPRLEVTFAGTPMAIDKDSKDFDFGLRLELERRGLHKIAESSYYYGRSSL